MKLTRAITHIRLADANSGKLTQLDALAQAYIALCQEYVTAFCTVVEPDKFAAPWLASPLSARWHQCVIQHASGIARSWRTNQTAAYSSYLDKVAAYQEQFQTGVKQQPEPVWHDWRTPVLKQVVLQANANVVKLETSDNSRFDYWLKVSTLEKGSPLRLPLKLSAYHRRTLVGQSINSSMTLSRREDGWWLALSVDEEITPTTTEISPVVGVDVGLANFITTSAGKQYGTFHGKLRQRLELDHEKRRRKAKLRACLEKKGVTNLPSVKNRRLGRHIRQAINLAVNQFFNDHPGVQVAYEDLSVATMRFKARRMNAYLRASNLAHLPKQLAWGAQKRGQRAKWVVAAYSSQECSRCHYTARHNRPDQQTFCCQVCGYRAHADENAAVNIQSRFRDREMQTCRNREQIKALLQARHQRWCDQNGWS